MNRIMIPLLLLSGAPSAAMGGDASTAFGAKVMPILAAHCAECHGGAKPKARLDLTGPRTLEQLRSQGQHWFTVLDRIDAGTMPPKGFDPLKPEEKAAISSWVRGEFKDLMLEHQRREGRAKLRRLSRAEYANTIHDIFGLRPPVARMMPADGRVDGYEKIAAALPFSTAGAEGQLQVAEIVANRLFEAPAGKTTYRLWAKSSEQSKGHVLELPDGWRVSFNTDTTSGPLGKGPDREKAGGFPGPRKPGLHRLRISAYGYQTDKPLPVGIYVGHVWSYPQLLDLIKVVEIPPGKPAIVETVVYLRTGRDSDRGTDDGIRLIPLGLGVPVPKNTQASVLGKGPGLALQWVDVEELEDTLPGQELLTAGMPAGVRAALTQPSATLKSSRLSRDELQAAVAKVFKAVGARLFRRDLSEAELAGGVAGFMKAADAGGALRPAFVNEIATMMTAPDCVCLVESPGRLTNFALASRLAYFLWNSAPDDELLGVARAGKLTDSKVLEAQTERLLRDPRSDRFVKDFLDQWLGLWGIDNTTPDKDIYPEYDDVLKVSSLMETQATFRHMLANNLGVRDFVAPRWAMLNDRLARHYGISGVGGFAIREVPLPADTPFGGIWTQASTMKVTANGTLTSPVKRGVWVAERLLGTPIPPPPPNIDPVEPDTRGAKTLREQLALHSGKGTCAACHAKFDPYGFALESFDVMGAFRANYRVAAPMPAGKNARWKDGLPVDSTGVTPDGKPFSGVRQLREILAKSPADIARGVTRHLITYATGQPSTPLDQAAIEAIVAGSAKDGHGLRSLVHGVVQSDLFRSK